MKNFITLSAILAVLIGLGILFYDHPIFQGEKGPPTTVEDQTPKETTLPVVRYPVPEIPQPKEDKTEPVLAEETVKAPETLPESDETLQELLTGILNEKELTDLFLLTNLIQRFVVTVDSLPEKQISPHHLPVKSPAGSFLVSENRISLENDNRYTPYVRLAETVGVDRAVTIYVKYYALFQKAYRELGYPKGHFNDRFVAVIEHLLETPEFDEPLEVVRPMIVYKYTDETLEGLSAGQKVLLRIGSDNRARIKALLKELWSKLTSQGAST